MKKADKNFSGRYAFGILLVLVFMMIPCLGMMKAKAADTAEFEYTVTFNQTEARSMLDSINEFRTGEDAWYWNEDNTTKIVCSGLNELKYDYELEKVAMQRAAEIAIHWGHERPDGSSCWTAYYDLGYTPEVTCGENLAAGQSTALEAYIGLREDDDMYAGQGHRRNMLKDKYTAVGIGCAVVNGRKFWVQEFSGNNPSDKAPEANDSDTKVKIKVAASEVSEVILIDTADYSVKTGESISIPSFKVKVVFNNNVFKSSKNSEIIPDNEYVFDSADGTFVQINNGMMTGLKEGTGSISKKVLTKTVTADVTVKASSGSINNPTPEPTAKPTATPIPTVTATPTATPIPSPTHAPGGTPALDEADVIGDYSGISFTFTDIRTNKKVTCKTDDGTPKVIVLGGIGTCGNTKAAMISLSDFLPKIDGKLDVYCIDIKDNTIETMTQWLDSAGINAKIYCGSQNEFDKNYEWYFKILDVIPETKGRWTMPAVIYLNGKGKIAATTVAYQYPETIKSNLEKIVYFLPEPTATPTPEPTKKPTAAPTATPTPEPTKKPTAVPTATPTPEPTKKPTTTPTATPTPEPTATPTSTPKVTPTPEITPEPTATPVPKITPAPTQAPVSKGDLYEAGFGFKDASNNSKVSFDGGDGTLKIVVVSDLLNCWYTMDMLYSINSQIEGTGIQLFAVDTKGTKSSTLGYYLEHYDLEGKFWCTAESSISGSGELGWSEVKQAIMNAAGVKASSGSGRGRRGGSGSSYSTPLIAYIDGYGNIVKTTTGYVDDSTIYDNIVALINTKPVSKGKTPVVPEKPAVKTNAIVSTKTAKTGEVTQTVLLTDVTGVKTLTVTTTDADANLENIRFTVSGKKATLALFAKDGGSIVIPGYIKLDGIKYYVKAIGKNVFGDSSDVSEITLGKYVTKIAKNAFNGMKKLSVINLDAAKLKSVGKKAFKGISKNAVFNISGTKEQFEKAKELIKKSGVAKTVTFNHVS